MSTELKKNFMSKDNLLLPIWAFRVIDVIPAFVLMILIEEVSNPFNRREDLYLMDDACPADIYHPFKITMSDWEHKYCLTWYTAKNALDKLELMGFITVSKDDKSNNLLIQIDWYYTWLISRLFCLIIKAESNPCVDTKAAQELSHRLQQNDPEHRNGIRAFINNFINNLAKGKKHKLDTLDEFDRYIAFFSDKKGNGAKMLDAYISVLFKTSGNRMTQKKQKRT